MEVRNCRRCGKVEIVSDPAAPERQLEVAGAVFPLCEDCYREFFDWFHHVELDTSYTRTA